MGPSPRVAAREAQRSRASRGGRVSGTSWESQSRGTGKSDDKGKGKSGDKSQGKGEDSGKSGEDKVVRVPVGTQLFEIESGDLVGDITEHEQRLTVARGGKGGRGNIHFATATDRAPRKAEPGQPGQAYDLRLELKVLADVGLLLLF